MPEFHLLFWSYFSFSSFSSFLGLLLLLGHRVNLAHGIPWARYCYRNSVHNYQHYFGVGRAVHPDVNQRIASTSMHKMKNKPLRLTCMVEGICCKSLVPPCSSLPFFRCVSRSKSKKYLR